MEEGVIETTPVEPKKEAPFDYWSDYWNILELDSSVILENLPPEDLTKLTKHFTFLNSGDLIFDLMGGDSRLLKKVLEMSGKSGVQMVSGDLAGWLLKNRSQADLKVLLDAKQLFPFRENSFPLVFCSFGLNYLTENEIANLISNVSRVLKEDGKFLILGSPDFCDQREQVGFFDEEMVVKVKNLMKLNGFEKAESDSFVGAESFAKNKNFLVVSGQKS